MATNHLRASGFRPRGVSGKPQFQVGDKVIFYENWGWNGIGRIHNVRSPTHSGEYSYYIMRDGEMGDVTKYKPMIWERNIRHATLEEYYGRHPPVLWARKNPWPAGMVLLMPIWVGICWFVPDVGWRLLDWF